MDSNVSSSYDLFFGADRGSVSPSPIKAIETVYNGYRFQSRLEARWAVFFDAAGIRYQYEPEGFEVDLNYGEGEPNICRYLPDFYLPDLNCYAEVKPSKDMLLRDERKLNAMIDFQATPICDGLLILGQIPPVIGDWIPSFIKYYWHKGVAADLVQFEPAYSGKFDNRAARLWTVEHYADGTGGTELPGLHLVNADLYRLGEQICTSLDGKLFLLADYEHRKIVARLNGCFNRARQARFEHGEKP